MTRRRAESLLNEFVATYHRADFIDDDPIGLMHAYRRPEDVETSAFLAAALAYGRAAQIRNSITRVFRALGDAPHDAVAGASRADLKRRFKGFVHRFTDDGEWADFVFRTGETIRADGSLRAAFAAADAPGRPIAETMSGFVRAFRDREGARPQPGYLLPDPADGSACKRFCLFLRWMVRPADGVDFGLWPEVGAERLIMPLDTHVARISRRLGLLRRASNDWKAAEEVTRALRRIAPDDPLRYDFAITHIGITGLWKELVPDTPPRNKPARGR